MLCGARGIRHAGGGNKRRRARWAGWWWWRKLGSSSSSRTAVAVVTVKISRVSRQGQGRRQVAVECVIFILKFGVFFDFLAFLSSLFGDRPLPHHGATAPGPMLPLPYQTIRSIRHECGLQPASYEYPNRPRLTLPGAVSPSILRTSPRIQHAHAPAPAPFSAASSLFIFHFSSTQLYLFVLFVLFV